MRCRTESVRTRALQTAIQTEDEFLEYARAFHRTTTEAPQTTLGSHAIKEETPAPGGASAGAGGGLVGGHGTQYASS